MLFRLLARIGIAQEAIKYVANRERKHMAHNTETSTSAIPNDPSDAGTADALLAALPPLLRNPP